MRILQRLTRKKFIAADSVHQTQLARCLNTLDLTALGIGSTLGAGIYVVAGQVAKQTAGPSVFVSFMIAALASILAGLCYAEFGARVPKTGSAYVYSYVTIGELMAFVIGWNLILEYVIGTASVARAWSSYFDSLVNNTIQTYFRDNVPMNISGLSPYPDFFAFGITIFLSMILAVGVKESSRFNNLFTAVNLLVVTYIVVCGAFKADSDNWNINPDQVVGLNSTDIGEGGFLPFGFSGMLSGAATCFYAFVGFDAIATTGEEVKNPQKAIPISIVISLLACFFAYSGISIVITLMCPYYLLDGNAPLPAVFDRVGWHVARYIIAVGAVCGLSTSLMGGMFPLPRVIYAIASDGLIFKFLATISERFKTPLIATVISGSFAGAMFPLPRVIYAIASDGLIFKFLATVSERFKTPLIATLISGFLAGVMAMLFDLKELVDMMSIGTLLAYTLVAVSVLLLRYRVHNIGEIDESKGNYTQVPQSDTDQDEGRPDASEDRLKLLHNGDGDEPSMMSTAFNFRNKDPSNITEKTSAYAVTMFSLLAIGFSVFLKVGEDNISARDSWAIVITVIFSLTMFILLISLACQPQNKSEVSFKVPWLPFLPGISIFVNIFLMLRLPEATWIRFAVWMAIGFLIYISYGLWNNSEPSFHDKLSLSSLKPQPHTEIDELFDDTETEINIYVDHTSDENE